MRSWYAVVNEPIVDRSPGTATVIGSLDDLAEPARGLRCVEAIGIGGRGLDVVDLPAAEVRTLDLPITTLAIRFQNERTLARSDKKTNGTHNVLTAWQAYAPLERRPFAARRPTEPCTRRVYSAYDERISQRTRNRSGQDGGESNPGPR